ncbi:hypothetical protein O6H91_23G069800 [Diphasiastrum complanatum]|uniref:Uncharacterized protein n=1 Tax=Diphasiastrum complanatum TaxID=34168 RepID=A0ACC2AC17_DIPCM|nr:hypothetical protein O6H91_23G069800 [Diphasiastrum complanatum]
MASERSVTQSKSEIGESGVSAQVNVNSFWDFSQGTIMSAFFIGIIVPIIISFTFRNKFGKKVKERGVTVVVGGEPGIAKRNHRYLSLVETASEGATTLATLFEDSCSQNSLQPFLGTRELIHTETEVTKDGRTFEKVTLGNYVWTTYREAFQEVLSFASGLAAIGHKKGERLAIFAETRAEWLITLQGCFRRNITVVTIYASLGEEALAHSLNETEVTTVVCDRKQLKKLVDLSRQLETVKRIVYMDDETIKSEPVLSGSSSSWAVLPFSEVKSLGRENPVDPDLPAANDVAVIMYTSGSTGVPKGVMMSHANVVATVAGVTTLVRGLGTKDKYMAYLPLAHLKEVPPSTFQQSKFESFLFRLCVLSDILHHAMKIDSKGGLPKKIFEIAYNRRLAAIEGSWLGAWGVEKLLWENLVFQKISNVLGGQIRCLLSGGAPLSGDTQRFINICFGAPIVQGYGLTETCAGATFSEWDDLSIGRVGPPIPSCYIKLVNWEEGGYLPTDKPMPRGEIVIGGPSVTLGYFKNQAKTDEVYKVDERGVRWFYTGDIGRFHPDGCLEIIDRRKDIVKLQHGEYVSLGKVEAVLSASSYVENIMLHADPFRNFCVALVVASHASLESWATKEGIIYKDFSELCEKKEAVAEVLKSLAEVGQKSKLERYEVPTKVKLLAESWTPESGLVTAALKIKRENIKKTFAADLKHLYEQ